MPTYESAPIKKLLSSLDDNNEVQYALPLGEQSIALNPIIGKNLTLTYGGHIACQNCGKKTKKSYSQGFCYPCMQKLAQCDMCILKPETCHHHLGTCREPSWGEDHCMVPHYVYLSNTSSLKVGITRHTQLPTRWIDQGATQGLPIFKVNTRLQSGQVEIALAKLISDKTNWRAMLKSVPEKIDLKQRAAELIEEIGDELKEIEGLLPLGSIEKLDEEVQDIHFPVLNYPEKISSFNFDKTPTVGGTLVGIKGQYLFFDTGVINIRKFTSYHLSVSHD